MRLSTLVAVLALTAIVGWIIYNRPVGPKPHRFAPEGTYFLKEYASFSTDHGMIGVEPGETVHLVRVLDASRQWMRVAGRDGEFDVSADSLTNDIDLAEAIRLQDQSAQADSQARTASISQQQADQQAALAAARASAVQQTNVAMTAASAVGGYKTRLHEPATAAGASYTSNYYYSSGSTGGGSSSGVTSAGSSSAAGARPAAGGSSAGTASSSLGGAQQRYTQDPSTRLQMQGGTSQGAGAATWR